jgi:hypothetical protein
MNRELVMFKKLLPLLFLFTGFQVNATIIEQSDGALDWQYDNVSGLQWLDLTLTDNYSIQSALNTYTGWRLANKSEFQLMFGQYEISGDNLVVDQLCTSVSDNTEYTSCLQDGNNGFVDNLFSQHFGATVSAADGSSTFVASYGWYDEAGTRRIGGVVAEEYVDQTTDDSIYAFFNAGFDYSDDALFDPASEVGQYLVRDAVVPEPSIISLFALGLVGIGFARRRRQS